MSTKRTTQAATRATAASPATPSPTAARGRVMPEDAHAALLRTRDHLQLLARLTTARIVYDADELELPPQAIAYSFQRLASDLDGVIATMRVHVQR